VRERRSEEVFATLCMVVIEPARREATLFLAGHPPRAAREEPVQLPDDLWSGARVIPGVVWGSRTLELADAWRMLFFTDGLVEGWSGAPGERLGVDGLLALAVESASYTDSAPLVDELIHRARELHGGDLTDDLAVLVVDYQAGDPGRWSDERAADPSVQLDDRPAVGPRSGSPHWSC